MKKPEWLFVGVLILVGAYFSYKYFSKAEEFNPLELVPKSSVAVYETKDPLGSYVSLADSKYWQDLKNIKVLNIAGQILASVDSIVAKKRAFSKGLQSYPTLISLHVTGNESSGLMYYLPTGIGTKDLLEEILQYYSAKPVQYKTRVYDGLTIHELQSGEHRLTFINHKNYVVVSTVGYLVEDVVRNLNNDFTNNFLTGNSNLLTVPKLNDDIGN